MNRILVQNRLPEGLIAIWRTGHLHVGNACSFMKIYFIFRKAAGK